MMKNKKNMSTAAMVLSVIAVILSGVVSLTKTDILNLAGTQWILIGIVLAIYAVYLSSCNCGMEEKK
jgi:hypothetical protein